MRFGVINKIKNILNNKKICRVLTLLFVFASSTALFPIGLLHSSTKIETTANYLAEVAKNGTVNGKYSVMMVEPKEGSNKKIGDNVDEFLRLYGIFREGLATYAGAVNSEKKNSVKVLDFNNDTNYSFFNIDRGYGAEKYEDHFKTITYPLEVMYKNSHPYDPSFFSFCYISKSCADILLDKEEKEHIKDNYDELIHSGITIQINGHNYKYYIDNIYFETNYFYNALTEAMGDFLIVGRYPDEIYTKQALFFLRDYAYQNKYYIEYVTSTYGMNDFNYKILKHNFKPGFFLDENNLVFICHSSNILPILLVIICILFFLASALFIIFGRYTFSLLNTTFAFLSILIPYMIYFVVFKTTKSVALFSSFSVSVFFWCIAIYALIYIISFIYFVFKDHREHYEKNSK